MNDKVTDIIIIIAVLFSLSAITYGSKAALDKLLTIYGIDTILWISAFIFSIELMITIVIIIGIISMHR